MDCRQCRRDNGSFDGSLLGGGQPWGLPQLLQT